jgi:DNA-binding beta-propeller fold protein YncE
MGTPEDLNNPNGDAEPFASVRELKDRHAKMLRQYREALGTHTVHDDNSPMLRSLLPDIKEFIARGRATGAVINDPDERAASQTYLDYWVSVLYRAGVNRDEGAHDEATLANFDPDLAPEIAEDLCPYIGLDAFQEHDQDIFHGRKPLVEEMLGRLGEVRLLAVVGPSGSGKSSAVLAGLVPALRAGRLEGSGGWKCYPPMVPGANPLRNLALAVRPAGAAADAAWVEQQEELFARDGGHLRALFEAASDSPSVLIVDQWEEVFTLCHDESRLRAFVENLLGVLTGGGAPHRVVLTMRIEFQEQMPRLDAFYQLFQQGLVQVLPLSTEALREAIEKPAAAVGLKFEKGVVERLIKEIVGEPAGLPLLQFTLLELWRRRRGNLVTMEDYEALGGARQALAKSADRVYDGLLLQDQEVAKRIFLRLAWAGEGVEVLRNRVRRRDLYRAAGVPDQVDGVLRRLVAARLVRLTRDEFALGDAESPDDQFEVTHEALIRNWQRLVDWLQAERETLRQRIRLRSAAEQWKAHGRDPGGLLGGSLLVEAMRYTDLDELERKFVDESKKAEEAATAEREATRQRELSQLQELAAEQQARAAEQQALVAQKSLSARRLRYLVVGLALALLFTGGAAAYALSKQREATRFADDATRLAADAHRGQQAAEAAQKAAGIAAEEARVEKDAAQKLRDAAIEQRESMRLLRADAERKAELAKKKEAEAQQAKRDAEAATKKITELNGQLTTRTEELKTTNIDLTVAKQLADKNAADANLRADELKTKKEELERKQQELEKTQAAKEEEYKKALAALLDVNREREVLKTELARARAELETQTAFTAFSSDQSKLVSFSADQGVRVWDRKTMEVIANLSPGGEVTSAALSGDGKRVLVANSKGEVVVADVSTGKILYKLRAVVTNPTKLFLSADSRKLAVLGGNKDLVKVVDVTTAKVLGTVETQGRVVDLAFSPDGQHLALTDAEGQTTLVKLVAGQQVTAPLGTGKCHSSRIELLDLSPAPDIKATLQLETICGPGSDVAGVTSAKVKQLDPRQRDLLLGPGQQPQTPATATAPPPPAPAQRQTGTSARPVWKLFLKIYKRGANGALSQLSSYEIESETSEAMAAALEKLTDEGISAGDVRDISKAINDYVQGFEQIAAVGSDPTTTQRLEGLTQGLFLKIADELNLPLQKK